MILNYLSIHEFSISGIEWTIMLYIIIIIFYHVYVLMIWNSYYLMKDHYNDNNNINYLKFQLNLDIKYLSFIMVLPNLQMNFNFYDILGHITQLAMEIL